MDIFEKKEIRLKLIKSHLKDNIKNIVLDEFLKIEETILDEFKLAELINNILLKIEDI